MLDFLPLHIAAGFSFASDWFFHHMGTKYTGEIMLNPMARIEMEAKQQQCLPDFYPKLFPQINKKGNAKLKPSASLGIGVATIPKILGCITRFTEHMNPIALPLLKDTDDPMQFKEPEHLTTENMQWLFEEIDTFVEHGYEKSHIGLPDLQGELNIAMKIVGDDRLLGLIARKSKEDVVRHILDVTSDVYIKVQQTLRKATNRSANLDFSIAGCTYFYLSPTQWTKFILPLIFKQQVLSKNIRLHHCGLANTEKIEAFAQYQWNSVEFGFGSDLKRARQLFNHPKYGPVPFSCRVSPYRMLNQSAEQITRDVNSIIEQVRGGPVSINVVGIPDGTPDANLYAMKDAVEFYNKQKEVEMDEDDLSAEREKNKDQDGLSKNFE